MAVRRWLTARVVLTGLAIGLVAAAAGATAAWGLRQGNLRLWMALAPVLGLAGAGAWAWRRRWPDTDVALYLDGRWKTDETITTALEMRQRDTGEGSQQDEHDEHDERETQAVRALVLSRAVRVLKNGDAKRMRPGLLRLHHGLIPLATAAFVFVCVIELPAKPQPPVQPGEQKVVVQEVEALKTVAALEKLLPPDPEQRERLAKIAEDAKKLQQKLAEGMPLREAQAEIARLRDAIAAERAAMSSTQQRAGLEAARERLARHKALQQAAKALGDRDLTAFDEAMQKLANEREQADRAQAQQALEEAANAAEKKGAKDVAEALREQKRLLEERQRRAKMLRELADALGKGAPSELQDKLRQFEDQGTDASAAELADRIADALGKLSEAQRQQLLDRLKKQLADGSAAGQPQDPMSSEQLESMLDHLSTPQGQRQLEQMLRDMANAPPSSEHLDRDRALGEAEKGLAAPLPVPSPGEQPGGKTPAQPGGKTPGQPGGAGSVPPRAGASPGANGKQPGGPGSQGHGSGPDTGRGDHKGETRAVETDPLRAGVSGPMNPGPLMPGVSTGRARPSAGESANVRGTQGIGQAAPGEVSGAQRSDIPNEYREQIGRYFRSD